jgi:[ribosomal protein S5]-alanine N-acetyltransferase
MRAGACYIAAAANGTERRMLRIRTARLDLVAATAGVARHEAAAMRGWHAPLEVLPPPSWPPPGNDRSSQMWLAGRIARDADPPGWWLWYVIRRPDGHVMGRELIGNAGFKGAPDERGSVELGYALLPCWHGHGYGTELAGALVGWAFSHEGVARIMAETYPDLVASVRVLEKHGFQATCRGAGAQTLRFELRRSVFEKRGLQASSAGWRP